MKSFKFLPLILVFILVFSSISAAQTPEITIWCSEKQVDILQKDVYKRQRCRLWLKSFVDGEILWRRE